MKTKQTLIQISLLAAALLSGLKSPAATSIVTNTADSGPGTLRQIIASAASGDTINFATNLSGSTITLTNGQLILSNSVTIDASALTNGIQISGNGTSRVFYVTNGSAVVLTAFTIISGVDLPGINGGGIYNNRSTVTLNQCTVAGNFAEGINAVGGGIYNNFGTVNLNQCTLIGNSAPFGGGIGNNVGSAALNQCTVTGNNSSEVGGGIYLDLGSVSVNQSTIAGNYGYYYGGGIYNLGSASISNSIVAGNSATYLPSGADIMTDSFTTTLGGSNIVQYHDQIYGGTISGTTPLTNAPLLAPPDNYGGLTQTRPPLPGSPAIDAGSDSATNLFATDQRGYPRLAGLHVDIGAVESAPVSPVVTIAADDGVGSLRQAILFATNGMAITFAPNLSGFVIPVQTGQLNLNTNLTIDASALPNGIQLSGTGTNRIFHVAGGTVVTLTALTITNGNGAFEPGNIYGGYGGGGIFNLGTLTVNRCTLAGNTANYNNSIYPSGGAVYNSGTLTLNECTLYGNHADNGNVGGGAIFSDATGNVFVNQCTLTGNSAINGSGGAINSENNLTIYNSIIAGNSLTVGVGADVYEYHEVSANFNGVNLIQDFYGTYTYTGYPPINAAPQLTALGSYGGPTPTMPPLPGSPAINACFSGTIFATDQRGLPRIVGLFADIGAVEGVYNAAGPGSLTAVTRLNDGSIQFAFTNYTDTSFTVLAGTNLAMPLNTWSNLGPVAESPVGSGHFQFTDPQATNYPQRFYRAREN